MQEYGHDLRNCRLLYRRRGTDWTESVRFTGPGYRKSRDYGVCTAHAAHGSAPFRHIAHYLILFKLAGLSSAGKRFDEIMTEMSEV